MNKFKVGDKVRSPHGYGVGTIYEIVSGPLPYCVVWGRVRRFKYGEDELELAEPAPAPRAWIGDAISEAEARKRVEVTYVIAEARKRQYFEDGLGELSGYWALPLQDAIDERLADGWTLKQVLPYGKRGVKFIAFFEREVSDEDMNPFSDRPDAVGGR